jgi:hypothetical protein
MTRTLCASVLALLLVAAPTTAQTHAGDRLQSGRLPTGWTLRLDRADAAPDEVLFRYHDGTYRVAHGPAGIYYNPSLIAVGNFRAEAVFVQEHELPHPEGYGLLIGGSDLGGDDQRYTYFLVRQDGKFLVRRRAGDRISTVADWTDHAAVAAGAATNSLAVEAGADSVRFLINGTLVTAVPRAQLHVDGLVGLRVNNRLTLAVRSLTIRPR